MRTFLNHIKEWNFGWNWNITRKFVATNDPVIWVFPILIRAHSETEVSSWNKPSLLWGEWYSFNYNLYAMEQLALRAWVWCSFGHVTRSSAWLIPHILFWITSHNQHASNIKYLANLIKKCLTCFCYQKLADFLVCFPPSVCVQGPVAAILENLLEDPTYLCFLRPCSQGLQQLFPKVGMTIENNILEALVKGFVSPILQIGDIDKITT